MRIQPAPVHSAKFEFRTATWSKSATRAATICGTRGTEFGPPVKRQLIELNTPESISTIKEMWPEASQVMHSATIKKWPLKTANEIRQHVLC
jgi:hypothetical protein